MLFRVVKTLSVDYSLQYGCWVPWFDPTPSYCFPFGILKRVNDFHYAGPQDLFDVNVMENNVTAPMKKCFGHFHTNPRIFCKRICRVRCTPILFLLASSFCKIVLISSFIVLRNVTGPYFVLLVGSQNIFFKFSFIASSSVIQYSLFSSTWESVKKCLLLSKHIYMSPYSIMC